MGAFPSCDEPIRSLDSRLTLAQVTLHNQPDHQHLHKPQAPPSPTEGCSWPLSRARHDTRKLEVQEAHAGPLGSGQGEEAKEFQIRKMQGAS